MTAATLNAPPWFDLAAFYIDRRIGFFYPIQIQNYTGRAWLERIESGESDFFWLREVKPNGNGYFIEVREQ